MGLTHRGPVQALFGETPGYGSRFTLHPTVSRATIGNKGRVIRPA
jgi:hypothetical protein